MIIFVDELPKSCDECNLNYAEASCCHYICIISDKPCKEMKKCPLQSLADYTKQVRKEVCNDFKSRFLVTCQIEKGCDTASFSLEVLNRILDQLQEDKQ